MKKIITSTATILLTSMLYAQGGVGINNTGTAPNSSAMLDVESSSKGLLVPRIALTSTTDATTITNGNVNSLLVYNTATISDVLPGYYYWNATNNVWKTLGGDADSDPTNEYNTSFSVTGGNLVIVDSGGNLSVPVASLGTDSQNLTSTIAGSNATVNINGGTSTTFSVNDADFDPTNEIELPATATTGQVLTWNGTNWGAQNTASSADNLGNHTATQNLDLSTSKLVGNGGSTGILIQNDGHTRIENLPQYNQATDTLLVIADNLGNLHQISLDSLASILVRDYGFTSTPSSGSYPPGAVSCTGAPTAVVDVLNPATGKTWMDRNLGASQVATSSSDALAYGDLYQWGRGSDGHQCRTSPTTSTLSSSDTPGHGNFILVSNQPFDWRTPQNYDLWQGNNGVNNPCPNGYRIPTDLELYAEKLSWGSLNSAGAFGSPLKFPAAGHRYFHNGSLSNVGFGGYYWSSTTRIGSPNVRHLEFTSSGAVMGGTSRASVSSVRCIKD